MKESQTGDGVYIPSKRCWGFLFQNGNVRVLAIQINRHLLFMH